jgi:hypothetical protein
VISPVSGEGYYGLCGSKESKWKNKSKQERKKSLGYRVVGLAGNWLLVNV